MYRRQSFYSVLMLAWCLVGPMLEVVRAQELLSLTQALAQGRRFNPELQAVIQREAIAKSNRQYGVADRYPMLDLTIGQNNYINQYNSPTNFIQGAYQDNSVSGSLSTNWLVYAGGHVGLSQARLDEQMQLATLQTTVTRQQVIRSISTTYYRTVLEGERKRLRAETMALSQARWQDLRMQQGLGRISTFDVLRAENLFLADSLAFLQQETERKNALFQLYTAIGQGSTGEVVLTDSLQPDPTLRLPAVRQMLAQNPTLRVRRTQVLLQANAVALQQTIRKPSIRLGSSFSQGFTSTAFPGFDRINGSSRNLLLAGFSLQMPLFRGFETQRAIAQAEIEKRQAEIDLQGQERLLSIDLNRLELAYENQHRILALAVRLRQNVARGLAMAQSRLINGFATLIEYRTVQLEYTEARLNELQAQYALKLLEIEIRQVVGDL